MPPTVGATGRSYFLVFFDVHEYLFVFRPGAPALHRLPKSVFVRTSPLRVKWRTTVTEQRYSVAHLVSVQIKACMNGQRPAAFPQAVRSAPPAAGGAPRLGSSANVNSSRSSGLIMPCRTSASKLMISFQYCEP